MKRIAIFASGSGSNAQCIAAYFKTNNQVSVECIVCNNPNAKVLDRARKFGIPTILINRSQFLETDEVVQTLLDKNIDLIVLAGFLWLIPKNLIQNFQIINIHPALLPQYGGKGMYGMNVHRAVVNNKETETGITIHMVNEKYDEGKIVFQTTCEVTPSDSPERVAEKVHQLEHKHYPQVIEKIISEL
ncbi:phosphoribosylglycinamide formyltransferase [Puteibacter caeruleilacunae]|nr:phosphoribosylglycinamide formyltransferase [Puteibacter caeruleilacunae]